MRTIIAITQINVFVYMFIITSPHGLHNITVRTTSNIMVHKAIGRYYRWAGTHRPGTT